jgi:hypothetical protein
MRSDLVSRAAVAASASLFVSLALMPVRAAVAQEAQPAQPPCNCSLPREAPRVTPRPRLADHWQGLDDSDEIATLDAIRLVLTEVGDGATYVWHRDNGRLSAVIHPTSSFKDATGRVCRHIVLVLTTGVRSGRVEGVACRLGDGRWQLEG